MALAIVFANGVDHCRTSVEDHRATAQRNWQLAQTERSAALSKLGRRKAFMSHVFFERLLEAVTIYC